jgi:hypothetical protein
MTRMGPERMPTTQPAAETEPDVQQEPAPLSRRELKERQKEAEDAERNAALVEGPPPARAAPVKSDSWLPPLFKDEEEEEVEKEEPVVVAASYAREAPEGKHLGAPQRERIVIPPAPKPVPYSSTGGHSAVKAYEPEGKTSGGTVLKIVGLSALYYLLPVVAALVGFAGLASAG